MAKIQNPKGSMSIAPSETRGKQHAGLQPRSGLNDARINDGNRKPGDGGEPRATSCEFTALSSQLSAVSFLRKLETGNRKLEDGNRVLSKKLFNWYKQSRKNRGEPNELHRKEFWTVLNWNNHSY